MNVMNVPEKPIVQETVSNVWGYWDPHTDTWIISHKLTLWKEVLEIEYEHESIRRNGNGGG